MPYFKLFAVANLGVICQSYSSLYVPSTIFICSNNGAKVSKPIHLFQHLSVNFDVQYTHVRSHYLCLNLTNLTKCNAESVSNVNSSLRLTRLDVE